MEIKKINVHNVLKCKVSDSVEGIAKRLKDYNDRRIFVVDEKDLLVGIITTTDLVYKVLTKDNSRMTAQDVMTKNVKSVDISEDLNKALEIMNHLKSFTCPMTDNGKVIGLVSYHDIIGYLFSSMQEE